MLKSVVCCCGPTNKIPRTPLWDSSCLLRACLLTQLCCRFPGRGAASSSSTPSYVGHNTRLNLLPTFGLMIVLVQWPDYLFLDTSNASNNVAASPSHSLCCHLGYLHSYPLQVCFLTVRLMFCCDWPCPTPTLPSNAWQMTPLFWWHIRLLCPSLKRWWVALSPLHMASMEPWRAVPWPFLPDHQPARGQGKATVTKKTSY